MLTCFSRLLAASSLKTSMVYTHVLNCGGKGRAQPDGRVTAQNLPPRRPMKPDLRPYLGRVVRVQVDRPLGSRHPAGHAIWYTVNYGFVPGTVSGDGSGIDAYVLGVHEPIETFEGVVVGIVVRHDDDEDKLVVAPEGRTFSADEIRVLVEFQERFFESEIVSLAGAGRTVQETGGGRGAFGET